MVCVPLESVLNTKLHVKLFSFCKCVTRATNPGSVVFQVAAFILNCVWVSQLSQKLDLLDDVLPLLPETKPDTQMVTLRRHNPITPKGELFWHWKHCYSWSHRSLHLSRCHTVQTQGSLLLALHQQTNQKTENSSAESVNSFHVIIPHGFIKW